MNPSDGFYQGNYSYYYSGVWRFCKEQRLCCLRVHKPRAGESGVRGELGVFFVFLRLGIFQIRLRSITYRCATSSSLSAQYLCSVTSMRVPDPPWKAGDGSVFVVAAVQLLLAQARAPGNTVAMILSAAG